MALTDRVKGNTESEDPFTNDAGETAVSRNLSLLESRPICWKSLAHVPLP